MSAVTSAYRYLLRSSSLAFAGDALALKAARQAIKDNFQNTSYSDEQDLNTKLAHSREVGLILRQNVVQGVRQDPQDNKYTLRIHKETELGDNDDIKKKKPKNTLGGEGGQFQGGCCQDQKS